MTVKTENITMKEVSVMTDSRYAHWLFSVCRDSGADNVRYEQKLAVESINHLLKYVRQAITELRALEQELPEQRERVMQMKREILDKTQMLCDTYCGSLNEVPMQFLMFVNTLPDKQDRIILKKRYFDGMRWGEISDQCAVPVSTLEKKNRKYIQCFRERKDDDNRDGKHERKELRSFNEGL